MTIATKHKGIVSLVAISIYNTSAPDFLNSKVKQSFGSDIGNNLDTNYTIAFQDAEYRDFTSCSASSFSFATTTKVGFINFYFSTEKNIGVLRMSENSHSYCINSFVDRIVAHGKLSGYLASGYFQFKELYYSEPLTVRKIPVVNPPPTSIVEGVIASRTSIPSIAQSVKFSLPASRAKSVPHFEAKLRHIFSCG